MHAIRFLFPHAPIRAVTLNGGMQMRAWFDIIDISKDMTEDEAGIREAQTIIEGIIENEIKAGIPAERILLAGFSQGGCMALHTGLRFRQGLAGILALFVHTTGTLSKLFSEAVEAIDPRPVEGIRATGANGVEDIIYGVIPQVLPLWISYSLYRFEANVRSASVVGMVGAGGIGMLLWDAIRGFQYGATATMLLVIIVTVSIVDLLSSVVRKLYI